uniref:Uncharacterized protein n=1 Tax=Avena sativa TaxID=4498 RepID=A0ACD5Y7H9_AVESA
MEAALAHADASTFPTAFYSDQDEASASNSSGRGESSMPARVAGAVLRGVITFVFATVGTILGAITGGLIGLATESGLVRGAGIGAISGAVVAMEVVDRSVAIWRSDESGIWSVLYVLDVIWSLLTGRLVREKVDPAVQNAVDSQMSAADDGSDGPPTLAEMFETGSASFKGMTADAIAELPATTITERQAAAVQNGGCSVCLQEFEAGQRARSLPGCGHTFHLPCIDGWLCRHASCPLCRGAV